MDDPAAVATLAVVRSVGGVGAVTLRWQLEDQAADDLSPFNGTLVFTEVQDRRDDVTKYQAILINLGCHTHDITLQLSSLSLLSYLISFQTETVKTFVIRALADSPLEGDEHFSIRLFPAESSAVIDPLNGQYLHNITSASAD